MTEIVTEIETEEIEDRQMEGETIGEGTATEIETEDAVILVRPKGCVKSNDTNTVKL